MRKQIGTCTLVENQLVNAFDGRQVSLLHARDGTDSGSGDKWLVKSGHVSIQARLAEFDLLYNQSIAVRAIAIGGSFLKGNVLIIGALEQHITWNGDVVLENNSSRFEVDHDEFFVSARRSTQSLLVEDQSTLSAGVNVVLPLGVKLIVSRLRDRIIVVIKMPPQEGGLDGICGNFNSVFANESTDVLAQRLDPSVPPEESLFGEEERAFPRIQLIQRSMLMRS